MYPVSNDFINAMLLPVIQSKISGTIDGIAFTEANILRNSLSIYAQNSGQDAIDIGTASSKELNITLMHSLGLTRSTLYGKEINLTYRLRLTDGTYESLPLGTYIIAEASWTLKGIEIVAYDYMSKFDEMFDETTAEYPSTGQAYDMIDWLCSAKGVALGMTRADIEALPNGHIFMEYVKGTASSYREYVAYLAGVLGCFAIVDRSDQLVFKQYSGTTYDSYGATERLTGASFSDFRTRYNGYTIQDFASGTQVLVSTDQYSGLTMDLGRNPFLNSAAKPALRANVLTELAAIDFAPFSARFNFPPIYDLGDCIKLTGGIGDDNPHVINYIAWTYNQSLTLEGYGKNPALATAQSALDQKIAGVASFTDLMATGYITETNRKDVQIGATKKTIVSMAAQASKTAEGVFTAMIPITMTEAGSVTFYHELAYQELRKETVDLPEGEHIVTLHDYMTFPAGVATNFRIRVDGDGAGVVNEFSARASLLVPSAQAATFDGNIILDDEVIPYQIPEPQFAESGEEVVVAVVPILQVVGADTAVEWSLSEAGFADATDSIRIIMHNQQYDRTLEDGETIRCLEDEDGTGTQDNRATEEEV